MIIVLAATEMGKSDTVLRIRPVLFNFYFSCIYADMHPELAIYCNLIASTIGDGHVIGSADGSAPSNSTVLSTIKLSACQLNKYELSESTDGDLIFVSTFGIFVVCEKFIHLTVYLH